MITYSCLFLIILEYNSHFPRGIFDGCHTTQEPNHAVAIVGYDEEAWLVKNRSVDQNCYEW